MKNEIMYNYNIKDDISVIKMNDKYRFSYKDEIYMLEPLKIKIEELYEIVNLNFENNKFYKIIGNKEKKPITQIMGNNYVLLKKEIKNTTNIEIDLYTSSKVPQEKYNLDRSDWYKLWSTKIDYFEYQLNHLEEKYQLISESIDYFIGMTESAISYVNETFSLEKKDKNDSICICHKRISDNNFYHPFNIVFDYKARDISEYLKYIFYSNKYSDEKLETIIKKSKLSRFQMRLVYGRMYYPSYYFDKYEKIINDKINEKDLLTIINRIEEYEQYLIKIYLLINKIYDIPKISWI